MDNTLENKQLQESYRWCIENTKLRARNFYYAIRLLPEARRNAMCAVYAFFRECDDISDAADIQNRRERLDELKNIINGAEPSSPMPGLLALRHAQAKYNINPQCFLDLIDGMIMDLTEFECRTFDDTYLYCYRAASTVGLVCISIFGFEPRPEVLKMAEYQGIAFQLTNILRDITPDAAEGRVYIPTDILSKFNITRESVLDGSYDEYSMHLLIKYMVKLTEEYYSKAEFLPHFISSQSRLCLRAMVNIYHGILHKISESGLYSLKHKARLSAPEKILAMLKAYIRVCLDYWYQMWADMTSKN